MDDETRIPRPTSASLWPLLARLIEREQRIADRAARGRVSAAIYEFLRFGVKEAWACLFGGVMVALLIATHFFYPRDVWLPRYDFLVVASIVVQAILLRAGMETWEEARVILLFHLVGTTMEIFKTSVGSWIYPEPSYLRIAGVPLFTGFMYASVGSYVTRSWRLFDYRFTNHPPMLAVIVLAAAIYINFFTNHWGFDARWWLLAATFLLMGRAFIFYTVWRRPRSMPMTLAAALATLFIWLAENVGTYSSAWLYPHQAQVWSPVGFGKFTSWFLLLIVSYAMVAATRGPRPPDSL